jgi:hypothetical protein
MEERRHYRGGLVWPVILISAGVIFLLNNLGVVSWGIWESLWRLWPVVLIAIGLDILIGRRSILGSLVVALLLIAALVVAASLSVPRWTSRAEVDRTESINHVLQNASSADVEIDFGTGSLQVGALAESNALVEGHVDLSRDERLTDEYRETGGVGRLRLKSENSGFALGTDSLNTENKRWELGLNRDIPMTLKIGTGVGRSTLDLARLKLTHLEINGGVGETGVTLPSQGRLDAQIDSGVGEATVTIPQGMAARIRVNRGLGSVDVSGNYSRRGDEYTSSDFNTAANRVDLQVNGGVGRIVIRQAVE